MESDRCHLLLLVKYAVKGIVESSEVMNVDRTSAGSIYRKIHGHGWVIGTECRYWVDTNVTISQVQVNELGEWMWVNQIGQL